MKRISEIVQHKVFGTVVPGDIKYVDTNKDGVIDAFDRVPIKVNNVPRSMSGLSLGVTIRILILVC